MNNNEILDIDKNNAVVLSWSTSIVFVFAVTYLAQLDS